MLHPSITDIDRERTVARAGLLQYQKKKSSACVKSLHGSGGLTKFFPLVVSPIFTGTSNQLLFLLLLLRALTGCHIPTVNIFCRTVKGISSATIFHRAYVVRRRLPASEIGLACSAATHDFTRNLKNEVWSKDCAPCSAPHEGPH
jgi:hypothetical protein